MSQQEITWTSTKRIADSEDAKSAALQLDDIRLQIRTTVDDRHIHKTYRQGISNVKALILNCVQAALSMVKDRSENSKRETARVSLVLKLLHKETDSGELYVKFSTSIYKKKIGITMGINCAPLVDDLFFILLGKRLYVSSLYSTSN